MTYHAGWNDPLEELIAKEQKTCKGCIFHHHEETFGIVINYCEKKRMELRRCKQYKEKAGK